MINIIIFCTQLRENYIDMDLECKNIQDTYNYTLDHTIHTQTYLVHMGLERCTYNSTPKILLFEILNMCILILRL